jgi:hypothetical protein
MSYRGFMPLLMAKNRTVLLPWSRWNEDFARLDVRQGAIWAASGATAGANETGRSGLLSGSDLVWTSVGTVPALAGGYRYMDGSQGFSMTAAAIYALCNSGTFTMIQKLRQVRVEGDGTAMGTSGGRAMYYANNNQAVFNNGIESRQIYTPSPFYSDYESGPLWVVLASNATENKVLFGWSSIRPKSLSDLASYVIAAMTGGMSYGSSGFEYRYPVNYVGYGKTLYWAYTAFLTECIF